MYVCMRKIFVFMRILYTVVCFSAVVMSYYDAFQALKTGFIEFSSDGLAHNTTTDSLYVHQCIHAAFYVLVYAWIICVHHHLYVCIIASRQGCILVFELPYIACTQFKQARELFYASTHLIHACLCDMLYAYWSLQAYVSPYFLALEPHMFRAPRPSPARSDLSHVLIS